MKIRTSDGVEIDGFEKIRTVRDAVSGKTLNPVDRKVLSASKNSTRSGAAFRQGQIKPVFGNSNMGDILSAVNKIKSTIWANKAYPKRGEVSTEVKENTKFILDRLCALEDNQIQNGVTDVSCSAIEVKEILYTLISVMQHMGKYSGPGIVALHKIVRKVKLS